MPETQELARVPDPVTLYSVPLVYRNFSGLVLGKFDIEGRRYFNIVLDEKTASQMEKDGWNIRWQEPREEGDPKRPILKVIVKYRKRDGTATRPPRIVLITSKGKTSLTEETVGILDLANIIGADLTINPYPYDAGGRTGLSAYLQTMFVTILEDPLEMRYLDVPENEGALASLPVDQDYEGVPV